MVRLTAQPRIGYFVNQYFLLRSFVLRSFACAELVKINATVSVVVTQHSKSYHEYFALPMHVLSHYALVTT